MLPSWILFSEQGHFSFTSAFAVTEMCSNELDSCQYELVNQDILLLSKMLEIGCIIRIRADIYPCYFPPSPAFHLPNIPLSRHQGCHYYCKRPIPALLSTWVMQRMVASFKLLCQTLAQTSGFHWILNLTQRDLNLLQWCLVSLKCSFEKFKLEKKKC